MSKLLAKLTAQGQNWTGVSGGSGPEVTASDVAAALSGINDRIQYHLMMVRGADQWPSDDETEMIVQEIQNLIVQKKTEIWSRSGGSDVLRVSKIRPLAECIWAEATVRQCDQRDIWSHLGVSERGWRDVYRQTYFEVVRDIESRFSEGSRKVYRAVYGDL